MNLEHLDARGRVRAERGVFHDSLEPRQDFDREVESALDRGPQDVRSPGRKKRSIGKELRSTKIVRGHRKKLTLKTKIKAAIRKRAISKR